MTTETANYCRIEMFGPLRLIHQDRITTHFRLQKAAVLLGYLALHPYRPQLREHLIDLLWPQLELESGRNNLSTTLSSLKHALEPPGTPAGSVLVADRQTIGLNSRHITTDVAEFEERLKRARSAAIVVERAGVLEEALQLYRGDLLDGYYEDWALTARNAFQERYREALIDWAQDLETLQEWERARQAAGRAVEADPLCEEATLVLMRVQARQGHAAGALETFRLFRQRLHDALATEPAQELRQLKERLQQDPDALYTPRPAMLDIAGIEPGVAAYAVVAAHGRDLPVKSPGNTQFPNNLPLQLTSFVGRETAVAEVRTLLEKTRLLTLTGVGGGGKTRLALQVAAEVPASYPDGVWQVELAALTAPRLVAQAVTEALGIGEQGEQSLQQTLIESLKGKCLLLLLDNCEHLLAACAQLAAALLRSCPGVKVLTTSREPLGIGGEQTYRIPSLSLPDPKHASSPESVMRSEAARLFIERALLIKPDFVVSNLNAPALAQLCNRLDGIPLAIELAAARVRSMPVEDINARLNNRFGLLTGGDRSALPRQQTLRALIDWSYDLLTEEEQSLLRSLSVFAGGFTLAGAEEVTQRVGTSGKSDNTLDLVTSLVDKSLVVFEGNSENARYKMLETIRSYSQEKLEDAAETESFRERHRRYFAAMAASALPHLTTNAQADWLSRLESDHDNFRAALGSTGDEETRLHLAGALWRFWMMRGHLDEGRCWLEGALNCGREVSAGTRSRALTGLGMLMVQQGAQSTSVTVLEEALALRRAGGAQAEIAETVNILGIAVAAHDDLERARHCYAESLQLRRDLGDAWGIAAAANNLGIVALKRQDYEAAHNYFEQSLMVYRDLGDTARIASVSNNLGKLALKNQDYSAARLYFTEALQQFRALHDTWNIALMLNNLGCAYNKEFHCKEAVSLFLQSFTESLALHAHSLLYASLEGLADAADQLGCHTLAAQLIGVIDANCSQDKLQLEPAEVAELESILSRIREALGEERFQSARASGMTLPMMSVTTLITSALGSDATNFAVTNA